MERLTCYYEHPKLDPLRPALDVLFELDQLRAEEPDSDSGIAYDELTKDIGTIPPEWFTAYAVSEISPDENQFWLNLRDPYVIEQLRIRMRHFLRRHDYKDLDFRDLILKNTQVTQEISAVCYESGLSGIISQSRKNPEGTSWSIFEGSVIGPQATIIPITPWDRDLETVCRAWSLRIPEELHQSQDTLDLATGIVVPTGGIIRGTESLRVR
jgi:hypothetical protein